MKVHNVRLGFATNSSSSHSIIFQPLQKIRDDFDYNGFGWEFFTLSSKELKKQYLSSMLVQNLIRTFPIDLIKTVLKGLDLPVADDLDESGFSSNFSIDHQSVYFLPKEYGSDQISIEFFNDFKNFLLKDGIVILGGNDNTDYQHPLYNETHVVSFDKWRPETDSTYTCRKDGDWWTLYSRSTGNRITFSFVENPSPFSPQTPLLVDMKITNFCSHGCAYCYQGSTTKGTHMNKEKIFSYTSLLSRGKVFEVALGGGEPTQYPIFDQLVKHLSSEKIVVNFTTKSVDWLENERMANEIIPHIGGFAFSVDEQTIDKVDRIYDIFKYRGYDVKKFTVQIIPAIHTQYSLEKILKWCHERGIRATLLGYKNTNRGQKFKDVIIKKQWGEFFPEEKTFEVLKKLQKQYQLGPISIDTTLAAKIVDQLKQNEIPEWLYHIHEGKYSMYIDAVEDKFGPSSYHLDKLQPVNTQNIYSLVLREMFSKVDVV